MRAVFFVADWKPVLSVAFCFTAREILLHLDSPVIKSRMLGACLVPSVSRLIVASAPQSERAAFNPTNLEGAGSQLALPPLPPRKQTSRNALLLGKKAPLLCALLEHAVLPEAHRNVPHCLCEALSVSWVSTCVCPASRAKRSSPPRLST